MSISKASEQQLKQRMSSPGYLSRKNDILSRITHFMETDFTVASISVEIRQSRHQSLLVLVFQWRQICFSPGYANISDFSFEY